MDDNGITTFNKDVASALISSVTITISDVLTFSSSISPKVDSTILGEQVLEMVDSCFAETRKIYADAVHRFFIEDLGNFFIKKHNIPIAFLATVL